MTRKSHQGDVGPNTPSRLLMMWAIVGLVGAALLNSGCNSITAPEWVRNGFKVGPNYSPPSALVSKTWIEGNDPRTKSSPPRDGDWWSVFQDPILNNLVVQAYQQNPNLRAIGTRVLQARAQQGIAVGNLFPQSQQAMGLYDYGTAFGAPAHINATTFNLAWELDFWGKYRRQVESANAKFDSSVDNYDDALVTLLADVATNYVQYRVAQQRIDIARDNLKTQEKLVALADQQRKVGTANTLDVEQFRTLLEQTRSSIPSLQISLGQASDKLCILLGEPPHDLEAMLGQGPKSGDSPMPKLPLEAAVGLPADLLLRRPDVRSAERQVAAQSPQIGVAKADYYPSISIGTALGYADLGFTPLLASQGFLAFVTPQFSWNILNYGRILNNVRLQDSKTQEAVATFQNKVLTAAQEVQTALRGFLLSQEQADHLAKSAIAAAKATDIEEKLFTDIKADVNRLFTLENTLLQVQDQLAVAQGNIALNLIGVYRAIGGGWEIGHQGGGCGPQIPVTSPDTAQPLQLQQPHSVPQPR